LVEQALKNKNITIKSVLVDDYGYKSNKNFKDLQKRFNQVSRLERMASFHAKTIRSKIEK